MSPLPGSLPALTARWACNLQGNEYIYTNDLLALEGTPLRLDPATPTPSTPLYLPALDALLIAHPDPAFANFIHRGFRSGFRIGFNNSITSLKSSNRNHPSAYEHPQVVSNHFETERFAQRLVIPPLTTPTHISPLALVPKSGQPGKFRLITDLSSPHDHSINDGVDPKLCSLKYAGIDQAILFLRQLGPGALLAKIDLQNAYRAVPVHPLDQHLTGIKWNDTVYRDTALPFGLRSAPKIFTAVADALAWAMLVNGTCNFLHYLDDFLFMGPLSDNTTQQSLQIALQTCEQVGFPVAHRKTVNPTQRLAFLGIEIDTTAGTLSLPSEKLRRLRTLLAEWQDRRAAKKRDLLSLLGHLSHASTVVRPGRIFVRHLIDASTQAGAPHHFVRLSQQCRANLTWWLEFGSTWNGTSLWPPESPSLTCISDASGKWGCGAILSFPPQLWFQVQWPESWSSINIAAKEMVPVVVAAALWGRHWRGQTILFKSDNTATVTAICSGSARDPSIRHLLRCLFFFAASWQFHYTAAHIPGIVNSAADAISRNKAHLLAELVPSANPSPSIVPFSLQDIIFHTDASWTSTRWRNSFKHFMDMALPEIHHAHITLPTVAT